MIVNYKILNNYINFKNTKVNDIIDALLRIGIDIDHVVDETKNKNFIVGKIINVAKHPNADRLNLCTVDIGNEKLEIICGASNVKKDILVCVAKIGAKLPNGLKIKKQKIRGTYSNGMICSLGELGIEEKFIKKYNDDGIYVFDHKKNIEKGNNALKILKIDNLIIDFEVTMNRHDLMSIYNLSMELARQLNLKPKKINYASDDGIKNPINIKNKTSDCNNYGCLIIKNVTIKESPQWLKDYLFYNNIRSINNVVDLTNYINVELNQPLHAYDLDIVGEKIIIQKENKDCAIKILNDDEINAKNFVIVKNSNKILCLAGIMGGMYGSITNNTKNILLESANWNDVYIRKIIKKISFASQASISFSKKLPLNLIDKSLLRFKYLLSKIDKNITFSKIKHLKKIIPLERKLKIEFNKINRIIGFKFDKKLVLSLIEKKFTIITKTDNYFIIKVPERRLDIEIDDNIIEEIIKSYGFNNLPNKRININIIDYIRDVFLENQFELQNYFTNLGFNEIKTYSLTNKGQNYENIFCNEQIKIKNPINKNNYRYRTSLITSIFNCAKYNLLRNNQNVNLFEISKIYFTKSNKIIEENHLSFLLSSDLFIGINEKISNCFNTIKEIIISIIKKYNLLSKNINIKNCTLKNEKINEKNSAYIFYNDELIGIILQFNPHFLLKEKIIQKIIFIAELNITKLINLNKEKETSFKNFSDRQIITRDISFFINKKTNKNNLINYILTINKIIYDVKIIDIFNKDNKESVMIRINILPKNDLDNNQINEIIKNIIAKLHQKYNIILR